VNAATSSTVRPDAAKRRACCSDSDTTCRSNSSCGFRDDRVACHSVPWERYAACSAALGSVTCSVRTSSTSRNVCHQSRNDAVVPSNFVASDGGTIHPDASTAAVSMFFLLSVVMLCGYVTAPLGMSGLTAFGILHVRFAFTGMASDVGAYRPSLPSSRGCSQPTPPSRLRCTCHGV
jgi:hypothetical protein